MSPTERLSMLPAGSSPLPPGSTIGILGGGQLGRMLASAGTCLGLHFHIYCPDENAPAFEVARDRTIASYEDATALQAFAQSCDVVTFEFENIPLIALDHIEAHCPILPNRRALEVTQDRRIERDFLEKTGISVANWAPVQRLKVLEDLVAHGLCPAILKTARLGYDGKGQARINQLQDAKQAFQAIGEQPAIIEALVPFEREISLLLVRNQQGEMAFYDCPQNHHVDGILHTSKVPARLGPKLREQAHTMGREIADSLDYVGLLAIELFVVEEQNSPRLLVNEIAPRVHNSGHWTLDACLCDQFENHIRAIANWPLGSTRRHSNALMTNLLGRDVLDWHNLAGQAEICVHLYGKQGAKEGRKLGHVTQISAPDDC